MATRSARHLLVGVACLPLLAGRAGALDGPSTASLEFDFRTTYSTPPFIVLAPLDSPFPLEAWAFNDANGPNFNFPPLSPDYVMWGYASETGSVRAQAWAHTNGSTSQPPPPGDKEHMYGVQLIWKRSFTKESAGDTAHFTVNESELSIASALDDPQMPYLFPLARIYMGVHLIRPHAPAGEPVLTEILAAEVKLTTVPDGTCALEEPGLWSCEWGKDPVIGMMPGDSPLHARRRRDLLGSVTLTTSQFRGSIDISRVRLGEKYTIQYTLTADAWAYGAENTAYAFVGDPLDTASGVLIETTGIPAGGGSPTGNTCLGQPDPGRWLDGGDGTVTDTFTGLMWQKCALGHVWNGGVAGDPGDDRCSAATAPPTTAWRAALTAATVDRTAGYGDWRVPNVKELSSIAELSCSTPATDTGAFPDAPASRFWSSTPGRAGDLAMAVDFGAGDIVGARKAEHADVRLVRDAASLSTRRPLPQVNLGRPLPMAEGDAGTRALVFPALLERPLTTAVTVDYHTSDLTARAGEDYAAVAGTLTIPAGATRAEIRVAVIGDTVAEPDETLQVTLSNVSPNARLGVAEQAAIILDDEPRVSVGDASVAEGDAGSGSLAFPVTLDRAAPADVVVQWATADGTAAAGVDYAAATGSLTIPAGQVAGTIAVSVYGDRTVEPDETLTVTLTGASASARLGRAVATGTILNDDVSRPPVADAVLYVGSAGGPGNADGVGAAARFSSPAWLSGTLLVDGGRIRTFAPDGTVTSPYSSSPAASGIAVAPGGTYLVTEGAQHRVQRLDPTAGALTVLAGSGLPGSADGTGTAATFRNPSGVAVDAAGNAYVCDTGNFTIRMITPAGVVTTLAGSPGLSGTTDGLGSAARFSAPRGLAIHPASGLLYVGDGPRLRTVTAGGQVTTVAGSTLGSADGADPLQARFQSTDGLAVDVSGLVYVADGLSRAIRTYDPAGGVSTLAGSLGLAGADDGVGSGARFSLPVGISILDGFLWVTDNGNYTLRRVSAAGEVVTVAGQAPRSGGQNGSAATATFRSPKGIAPGAAAGVIFLADALDQTVRRVDPDAGGNAATVAAVAGRSAVPGSADGSGGAARFDQPYGVSAGGGYVADAGNCVLRAMDAAGNVTTVAGAVQACTVTDGIGSAARFRTPVAVWQAAGGTVYVADTYAVRAFDPASGAVTTVAGSGASGNVDATGGAARFGNIQGICGDAAGNLYVADVSNHAIRKIAPGGAVTTMNANAGAGGYRDGPLAGARFLSPGDVACADDGTLYVADAENVAIRKITPAGDVSTILGTPKLVGFAPMASPSVIGKPVRLALQGNALYVTMGYAVMKATLQ